MTLYFAEGATRTLLGRRPPAVTGPCDHLELGAFTIVKPRPLLPGEPPVSFGVPRIAGWRILGRSRSDYRVVIVQPDRQDLHRAADAVILTLDRWPKLRRYLDLDDPGPTLATAVWDLAGVLLERGQVRASRDQLADIDRDVPADSPIRTELAERAERAGAVLARLDADVAARVDHLTRLADETEAFVAQERALARARAVLENADNLLGAAPAATFDSAADLAEHTSAVLAAYRELTS